MFTIIDRNLFLNSFAFQTHSLKSPQVALTKHKCLGQLVLCTLIDGKVVNKERKNVNRQFLRKVKIAKYRRIFKITGVPDLSGNSYII